MTTLALRSCLPLAMTAAWLCCTVGCSPREPIAPENLMVSATGARSLTLTWQRGGGSETIFRVERKEGESFRQLAEVPVAVTHFQVDQLEPKQSYTFRVVAVPKEKSKKLPSVEASGTTQSLSLEEAVAAAKPSVILVRNRRRNMFSSDTYAFGTGFVIGSNKVITNHHVIEGASDVAVRLGDTWHESEVLASDSTNDLAILKVDHELPPALTLGSSDGLNEGTGLVAIGFPKILDLASEGFEIQASIAPGALTAVRQRTREVSTGGFLGVPSSVTCSLLQMSCPINSGNSGGPVLEIATGRVVGVSVSVLEGAEGIKFAVPVNYVQDLKLNESISGWIKGHDLDGNSPSGSSLFRDRGSRLDTYRSWLGNQPLSGSPGR